MTKKKSNAKKGNSAKVAEGESYTLDLECELSDAEFKERAHDMAGMQQELEKLKHEFSDVKADFKERIGGLQAKVREGLNAILTGREYRDVECREEINYATGKVAVVRIDTGETVEARDLTEEERQGQLLGGAAPPVDQNAVDRTPAGA